MTHPRPGHLIVPLCLAALVLGAAPLFAQADEAPVIGVELTPSELYRDVGFLKIAAMLNLSDGQVAKILPIVERVAEHLAADGAADEAAYAEVEVAADAVTKALLAGTDPQRRDLASLNAAANAREQRVATQAAVVAQAAADIQRTLTAEQAARIETAVQMRERKVVEVRLEGHGSTAEYVVAKLDEQADLMPDEYMRTCEARAVEIAEALLGKDAPRLRAMATALLRVMNQVAGWTPEEYAQQRPTLEAQVQERLRLPPGPSEGLIKHDEFLAWITFDRAGTVLETWLIMRAMENAPAEEEEMP